MTVNAFTALFASFFAAHHLIATLLAILQWKHLRRRGDKVPSHLTGKVDPETIRKSIRYNLEKIRFGLVQRHLEMDPLWFMIFFGFSWLDGLLRGTLDGPVVIGLLYIGILSLGGGLLALPFELYFTFSIEQRYGFNRRTFAGFIVDKLKEALVGGLLGGGLLAIGGGWRHLAWWPCSRCR